MGLPLTENSGVFRPNYLQNSIFPSGFPISQNPIFGIALKLHNKAKKSSTRITASLGHNNVVQGKEFEFKPSFDEYLKVMESVKSGREKQGPQNLRRNGGLRSKREGEDGKLRDFKGQNSGGVVIKEGKVDDFSNFTEVKRGKEKQGPYSVGENGGLRNKREGEDGKFWDSEGKFSSGVMIKEGEDNDFTRKVGKFRASEERVSSGVMTKEGKDDGFRKAIEVKKVVTDKKSSGVKMVWKSSKKSVLNEDTDGSVVLDMERAAFRPVEEFGDVYDRPRITRVDMEERIQKLAKCLNGADIHMPEWMFTNMMRSAKIRFSDHSMLRIIQILGKLGNWRRVLQVIEWIQSRERFRSHKIRYVYTAALNVLGKSRRPVEALNLFHLMQQHMSSYPDLVSYHCIAVTLGQAGHMKELFYVIDSMRSPKIKFKTGVLDKWDPRLEPDIVVYNAVLNACVRRKNWEGAFWVLQQLKQKGQRPSSTTYGLVMEVMFACGKYNLVHDFFSKMQKTCIPNALTCKVLLNTFWREGKIDEAILAVEDMERRGIVGTAGLYYDLARCLCSADRCQEALMQIEKLCRVANKPLVVTYTGLIQACVDSGNIINGAYIFNHMQNFCSPNLVTYNIMLKAFLDHGMFEEAKELFLRLLENSQSINRKSEYKNKVMPDLHTFNTMLDACAAEKKWDDVEFVYVKMLKYGYHFNAKRHLRLILDACNAGKGELLERIWNHMVQGDQIPPFLLTSKMFHLKLEQGDFTAALSCFACHPSIESHAFSTKWWLKFFMENDQPFEKDTFVKLVQAANSLIPRTDAQKRILQNLNISCMEILSKQMTSNELELIETAGRTLCKTASPY